MSTLLYSGVLTAVLKGTLLRYSMVLIGVLKGTLGCSLGYLELLQPAAGITLPYSRVLTGVLLQRVPKASGCPPPVLSAALARSSCE